MDTSGHGPCIRQPARRSVLTGNAPCMQEEGSRVRVPSLLRHGGLQICQKPNSFSPSLPSHPGPSHRDPLSGLMRCSHQWPCCLFPVQQPPCHSTQNLPMAPSSLRTKHGVRRRARVILGLPANHFFPNSSLPAASPNHGPLGCPLGTLSPGQATPGRTFAPGRPSATNAPALAFP